MSVNVYRAVAPGEKFNPAEPYVFLRIGQAAVPLTREEAERLWNRLGESLQADAASLGPQADPGDEA